MVRAGKKLGVSCVCLWHLRLLSSQYSKVGDLTGEKNQNPGSHRELQPSFMFPKNIHYHVLSPSFHKSKYILILLKRRQTSSESKAVTPKKEQSLTFHQQIHNSFFFPSILCYGLAKTYNGVTASASDPSESFENRTKKKKKKRLRYSRKELT